MFFRHDRGAAAAARREPGAERDRRLTFESLEHRYVLNGTLDASFGTGGLTSLSFLTEFDGQEINDIALQSDGKVVSVGAFRYLDTADSAFAISRHHPDGTLDSSFGLNGRAVVKFGTSSNDIARGVAIQSDGKIVVVGSSIPDGFTFTDFAVARLNADGSLDTSFDGDGRMTRHLNDTAYGDWATSVAIQTDGKIVVAGTVVAFFEGDFGVMRLNPNGSLDTTFDTDGIAIADFGSSGQDFARDVALQADGKIVVIGYSQPSGGDGDFAVWRINTNGTDDTTFDTDGLVKYNQSGDDAATGVAIQPDGKILVAGTEAIGGNDDFSVMRLNTNGTKDNTFSGDGRAFRTLGGNEVGTDVALHTDGSIFVIGYTDVGTDEGVGVWALRPDGSNDPEFGVSGAQAYAFSGDDRAHAAAVTADGRLVGGGYKTGTTTPTEFALGRVWTPSALTDKIGAWDAAQFRLDVNGNGVWDGGDQLLAFGQTTDTPITGDFNGDGIDEIGFHRGVARAYCLDLNGNGIWEGPAGGDATYIFGLSADTPIIGDFNGDGTDEIGLHRGSATAFCLDLNGNGVWDSPGGGDVTYNFGLSGDTPIIGDWNGDGTDEIGFYRDSARAFCLDLNGNGLWEGPAGGDARYYFGLPGDTPITGDWNGDGTDEIGFQRNNAFCVDLNGSGIWEGPAGGDAWYFFGMSGDTPISGRWAPGSPLLAAAGPAFAPVATPVLTADALEPIVDHAVAVLTAAPLTPEQQRQIDRLDVRIADLPGAMLGQAWGTTITLDINAAGYGWFVDPTPRRDEEFTLFAGTEYRANRQSEIGNRQSFDLLTAVMHEIGHVLGYGHQEDGWMSETLQPGMRRLVDSDVIDRVFASSQW